MDKEQKLLWEKVPMAERILAGLVDIIITLLISLFPKIGWLFGLIYLLGKDSFSFLNGQSFGKKLFHLRVITLPHYASMSGLPEKSVIRGLVLLIPILNIIDFIHLIKYKVRIADRWSETRVIKNQDWETTGN
ncbi:RDD family protein [Thermophagus sp. OGC60D27]|uniref:RDD family protein n=1 Tax=Thermophagus sp. OGC60D27 TaxID=3458415 RepID=UPI004037BC2A